MTYFGNNSSFSTLFPSERIILTNSWYPFIVRKRKRKEKQLGAGLILPAKVCSLVNRKQFQRILTPGKSALILKEPRGYTHRPFYKLIQIQTKA